MQAERICFDEIFVGELNRAIDVLGSTLPRESYHQFAHHLDLPGQAPQGFELTTYVSGAPVGDKYVIARTNSDPDAARSGMVFSHALITDLHSVGEVTDLRPIFEVLHHKRPTNLVASNRVLPARSQSLIPPPGQFCDMVTKRTSSAVVVSETDTFEDLCTRLWSHLPSTMRADFRFGIAFDPREATRMGLHFALVPSLILPRWSADRRADSAIDSGEPETTTGRYLREPPPSRLEIFAEKLELKSLKISEFEIFSRAYELSSNDAADFQEIITALRLISKFQPAPRKGLQIKQLLLKRAFSSDKASSAEDVLALRNFDWLPFSEVIIEEEVIASKFSRALQSTARPDKRVEFLESVVSVDAANEKWRAYGNSVLTRLNKETAVALAPSVWELLAKNLVAGCAILKTSERKNLDPALAKKLPDKFDLHREDIGVALADAFYFAAETALLRARHQGNELPALIEACQRDRARFQDTAIKTILASLSPEDCVNAALSVEDPIVRESAINQIVSAPRVLRPHDISQQAVQKIWLDALLASSTAWEIDRTTSIQRRLLRALERSKVDGSLMSQLMNTPVANWLEYENRAAAWELLPSPALHKAISQTAKAWIVSYNTPHRAEDFYLPEPALAAAIADDQLSHELCDALTQGSFDQALDVFLGNKCLSGRLFLRVVRNFRKAKFRLSTGQSERVGRLIVARDWRDVTRALFEDHAKDSDLQETFVICASQLSAWNRLLHGLGTPSRSELLSFLEEVACELYPEGPQAREVWTRAGGDPSRLDLTGAGRGQWRMAVKEISSGCEISFQELVETMQDDYPLNARLQHLKGVL